MAVPLTEGLGNAARFIVANRGEFIYLVAYSEALPLLRRKGGQALQAWQWLARREQPSSRLSRRVR